MYIKMRMKDSKLSTSEYRSLCEQLRELEAMNFRVQAEWAKRPESELKMVEYV